MSSKATFIRSRRVAVVLLLGGAVAAGPMGISSAAAEPTLAAAMTMPMGDSMPEHVASAYAALRHGHAKAATVELRKAVVAKAEPSAARAHAREALAGLGRHDVAMPKMHAASGAAVEHLTYALRALQAGQSDMARGHLDEARALPKVRKYASAAVAAMKHHDRAEAHRQIKAGLRAANRE